MLELLFDWPEGWNSCWSRLCSLCLSASFMWLWVTCKVNISPVTVLMDVTHFKVIFFQHILRKTNFICAAKLNLKLTLILWQQQSISTLKVTAKGERKHKMYNNYVQQEHKLSLSLYSTTKYVKTDFHWCRKHDFRNQRLRKNVICTEIKLKVKASAKYLMQDCVNSSLLFCFLLLIESFFLVSLQVSHARGVLMLWSHNRLLNYKLHWEQLRIDGVWMSWMSIALSSMNILYYNENKFFCILLFISLITICAQI